MSQAISREPREPNMPSATVTAFVVMLALTIGGITWVLMALSNPAALPIRKVSVEGDFTFLNPEALKAAVVDAVDAGFFALNVEDIRQRLVDEPWIRAAHIRRVWPDALHVSIVEQTPAARWGKHAMLNEQGDIFAPPVDEIPPGLVYLVGPLGAEIEILTQYRKLGKALATVDLEIAELHVSGRYAWTIRTADGKEIVLGRTDPQRRLRRFLFAHKNGLSQSWDRIGRIDLRYPNGLAVAKTDSGDGNG